jgi:type I restriction enzyme R subunit
VIPPFKLNVRIENFLKKFIYAKGNFIINDVADKTDGEFD